MTPILTRRAIRETPRFGFGTRNSTPKSLVAALERFNITAVNVPEITDPPLPDFEDLL